MTQRNDSAIMQMIRDKKGECDNANDKSRKYKKLFEEFSRLLWQDSKNDKNSQICSSV